MRPIATDGVAWSVGLSVTTVSEPCKAAEPIVMPLGMLTLVGPRNHVLDGRPDPHTRRSNILRAQRGRSRTCPHMPGGRYTQSDSAGAAPVRYGCRFGCTGWDARRRHLENTTKPSVCGGDAALCHIALITCLRLVDDTTTNPSCTQPTVSE